MLKNLEELRSVSREEVINIANTEGIGKCNEYRMIPGDYFV